MPTIETKDGIFLKIPEGMDPTSPEVKAAVEAERRGRAQRKVEERRKDPEFQAKQKAQEAEDRARLDPTKDMNVLEKGLANLGAGFHSFGTGVHQLLGGKYSDQEIQEKRARDAALAKSTDMGILPDWVPTVGSALQTAAETAPTMLIPGGGAATAGRLAGKGLAKTMARGLVGGPGRAAVTGGAVGGALVPTTSDESTLLNTVIGAGAGAVLPGAVKAYRGIRNLSTPGARASNQLVRELGNEASEIPGLVAQRNAERAGTSAAARAIPETLAEATGSGRAARLESETGRHVEGNPAWMDWRRGQNEARYGAVQKATQEAELLGNREAARDLTADPMRDAAMAAVNQFKQTTSGWSDPIKRAVGAVANSDVAAGNPSARGVVNLVQSVIDSPRPLTPGALYELRKTLAAKLEGPAIIGDDLSAAVKGAQKETLALMEGIDQTLNQASGGKWQAYLDQYGSSSRSVDASQAAQLAREQFTKTGAPEMGGLPHVTQQGLKRAIEAARGAPSRRFPLVQSPSAAQGLEDVMEHFQKANEPQRTRKLVGSAGGGSQSSLDLGPAVTAITGESVPARLVRSAIQTVFKGANERTQLELTHMLQNPDRAVAAIRMARSLNRPLTEAQTLLLQGLSRTAGTALPQAMAQQPQQGGF